MARGAGAFFGGIGDGLTAGMDRRDAEAERALRERELSIMEQYVANGGGSYAPPSWGGGPPLAAGHSNAYGTTMTPRGAVPAGAPSNGPAGGPIPGGGGMGAGFLNLIDRTEGGGRYDTLFGHSQQEGGPFSGVDVSNMTVGEAIAFSDPNGPYADWVRGQVGRVATPMGRYQIVGRTLRGAVDQLGIPLDAPFNAQTQDTIALHLARNAYNRAGVDGLRSEWEGLRSVDTATLEAAVTGFLTRG
jgi:flagellar protein FlgJ